MTMRRRVKNSGNGYAKKKIAEIRNDAENNIAETQ